MADVPEQESSLLEQLESGKLDSSCLQAVLFPRLEKVLYFLLLFFSSFFLFIPISLPLFPSLLRSYLISQIV